MTFMARIGHLFIEGKRLEWYKLTLHDMIIPLLSITLSVAEIEKQLHLRSQNSSKLLNKQQTVFRNRNLGDYHCLSVEEDAPAYHPDVPLLHVAGDRRETKSIVGVAKFQ
jgi:hypothetical protein